MLKAIDKESALRYASAGELAADLRRFLDGPGDSRTTRQPLSTGERMDSPQQGSLGLLAVPFLGLISLTIGGFAFESKSAARQRKRKRPSR